MPEYLAPGVYVEEILGQQPIEGVSTSTTGFVGMTVRGPTSGPPVLVTSFPEFVRIFGGYLPDSAALHDYRYLPYAARGFFENLGKRAYIARVPGKNSKTATDGATAVGGLITRLTQDATNGSTSLRLVTLRGIDTTRKVTLRQTKNGIVTTQGPITVTAYNGSDNSVTVGLALTSDFEARYTSVITDEPNTGTVLRLSAKDAGAWGNTDQSAPDSFTVHLRQSAPPRGSSQVVKLVPTQLDTVLMASSKSFYIGAVVEFDRGKTKVYGKIKDIVGDSLILQSLFAAATDLDPDLGGFKTTASTCEFDLLASFQGVSEQYRYLTLDDTTANYYRDVLEKKSNLLQMTPGTLPDNVTQNPFKLPSAPDGWTLLITGGADGTAPTDANIIGTDNGPGQRTGIQALIDVPEISIVAVPGITSQPVQNALITHCETLRYRFAILDCEEGAGLDDIKTQRDNYDTKYAAIYYPRIEVYDPDSDSEILAPPSGHMAGIYARVDNERGVWKAPANEVIGGITGLEVKLTKGDQDILNPEPRNICVLRDFRAQGRGLRVYGARCITNLTEWKYINVRRLFIFLEASLDLGTQWAVFEPNDERLWNQLIQSVSAFLTTVWREGGLMGTKAEEAFFVKCGRETMSQDDIDNGRLIMIVGVAPVFPAEFVIIRIGQWAGGSSVQEL